MDEWKENKQRTSGPVWGQVRCAYTLHGNVGAGMHVPAVPDRHVVNIRPLPKKIIW